jgi:hypothetical protein
MDYMKIITGPLDYQQKAPIAFLWIVKLMVNLFGNKEMCLRIIPSISGIASLFLFIPVSRFFLNKWTALLAIGILCFSPALIYHSVEIKQYATELLCAILSLYLFIKFNDGSRLKDMVVWGISGAVILWFSYSTIFILAGIGMGLSLFHILEKKWILFLRHLVPFSLWLVSFVTNYVLFTYKHAESEWVVYWFRFYENFMPFPPKSFSDLSWFPLNIYRMMDYPLGLLWNFNGLSPYHMTNILLKMAFLPIALLLIGSYTFFKGNRKIMIVIFLPIILTFLASGLELYPLTERFWVFIAPFFIIIIGKGLDSICLKIKSKLLAGIVFLLVITGPLVESTLFIFHPENFYVHKKSFQREVLYFISNNYKKDDAVYIYWNDLPQYRLYKNLYHFNYTAIEGRDVRITSNDFDDYYKNLSADFDQFSNKKRVWLVFNNKFLSNIGDKINEPGWYYKKELNPTDNLVKEFLKLGHLKYRHVTPDITVCLFVLNER